MKTFIDFAKKVFYIDFGTLDEDNKKLIFQQFTEEGLARVNVITAMVFLGEFVLMILDLTSGFFQAHSINRLNLVAAVNIMVYALVAVFIALVYLGFVPDAKGGSLFNIMALIFAFAFSTECLRSFSIKKLINNRMNELLTDRFSRLASQTIMALSNAVEAKDLYTKGHSSRVATYSKELARRLGYKDQQLSEIYYIGLLHDIGKIGVPDAVINKNGRLTDEEFAEIKKHPEMGYDILKIITEIPDISIGAKWHHEKYDGSGYPNRLSGSDIPRIAQIIAVADAYDAMTSTRSYRDVMPQSKVRSEIERNVGTQFAPDVAEIMLQMIDEDTDYIMQAGK